MVSFHHKKERSTIETTTLPDVISISGDSSSLSSDGSSHDDEVLMEKHLIEPHIGHKKVLVTGGAGFIGSYVADFLLSRGDDVVIVDEMNDYYDVRMKESNIELLKSKYGARKGRLSIYKGDICNEQFMLNVFEKESPKWVCHMAARAGVRPSISDPFVYIHSNIRGTTQLMELSHQFGVKHFVFASSSSVYGGSKSTYFSENENVDNPVSPYAASKKACELLAYTYHHLYNLNVSALRFFTVYGPRGRPDMAPFKFIDRVSRGVQIQQFGDGSSSRDYTYIDDIVDGVVRAIDRPQGYEVSWQRTPVLDFPSNVKFLAVLNLLTPLLLMQVYNLGKGNGTSLKDFINLVQRHTGKKANIRQLPDQPGDVPYTCANVEKAQKMLGYKAKVSFGEGIRRTAEWYKTSYEPNVCPEMQANGMGRAPSVVNLNSAGKC